MAKCPSCGLDAEVSGFDSSLEVRINFCYRCQKWFYESGLMFTCQTILGKSELDKLGFNRQIPLPGVSGYDKILQDLSYANSMRLHWIERFLNLNENDTLLDVGCGYGNLPIYFGAKYDLRLATGIDLAKIYVDVCREKAYKLKMKNVRFEQASAYDIPFENGFLNKVVCAEALEHLASPLDALLEMKRVCSDCLVIQIPCPNPLVFNILGHFIERIMGQKVYHYSKNITYNKQDYFPQHVFEPSSIEMKKYAASAGFNIENYVGTRLAPILLSKIDNKFMRLIVQNSMHFLDYKMSQIFPFKILGNQLIMQLKVRV